jgi:hypothetical protein
MMKMDAASGRGLQEREGKRKKRTKRDWQKEDQKTRGAAK